MSVVDGEAYLREAIESVLGQTVWDLELVAVDDGSQDGSRRVLEEFARADARVRVLTNDTYVGLRAALNQAWQAARSEYIARLDADDVALPDRLMRQVAFLDAHPAVAAVGGAVITIDADGRRGSTVRYATTARGIRATLERRNCIAHPTVMMRRSALEAVGGYRIDQAEDYDLWLRLAERWDLANLREPMTLYRLHPGQGSLDTLELQTRGRLAAVAAAKARRAGGRDPLEGTHALTLDLVDRLGIDRGELVAEVERDFLEWAAMLVDLGHRDDSARLLAQLRPARPDRTREALAAAVRLRRADRKLSQGRTAAAALDVLLALGHAPRYSAGRLRARLRDRFHGRS
jgi:hypothetical protein